jgi:hypothetical protein
MEIWRCSARRVGADRFEDWRDEKTELLKARRGEIDDDGGPDREIVVLR